MDETGHLSLFLRGYNDHIEYSDLTVDMKCLGWYQLLPLENRFVILL